MIALSDKKALNQEHGQIGYMKDTIRNPISQNVRNVQEIILLLKAFLSSYDFFGLSTLML